MDWVQIGTGKKYIYRHNGYFPRFWENNQICLFCPYFPGDVFPWITVEMSGLSDACFLFCRVVCHGTDDYKTTGEEKVEAKPLRHVDGCRSDCSEAASKNET